MSPTTPRLRRPSVLLASGAMTIGLIAASGGTAGAAGAPAKVDATNYTVSCTGFAGSVKFSRPETTAGTATPSPATDTIKASLSGCTVNNGTGTAVAVTGAKLTGALTNPTSYHKCGGATGTPVAITGSLTVKWKTTPKLTATSTVIAGSTATTSANLVVGAVSFVIGASSATGPFQGTDSGAGDLISGSTGPGTVAGLLATCGTAKGLKSLTLTNPVSGPAATLS